MCWTLIKVLPESEDRTKAREICADARTWFNANRITNGRAYMSQGNGLNYDGILTQIMVARYFNAELNDCRTWDKGIDITLPDGRTADVKATAYNGGNLLEFPDDVNKKRNDIYIFCTRTQKEVKVRGWISRKDFIVQAKEFDFGYGKRLYMHAKHLNQDFGGF